VFVYADDRVLVRQQVPGGRPPAKTIGFVAIQMTPPGPYEVPRRTPATPGQQGKTRIFHLVQVEDPFHANDEHEHAGQ
jgi:hypothetical protein